MKHSRFVFAAALLVAGGMISAVYAHQTTPAKKPAAAAPAPTHVIADADSAKFVPVPGPVGLPTTIQMSPVAGDPSKPGPFSLLLKIPANQVIAPHWHPAEENVVPLRGTFQIGAGSKFDEASVERFESGRRRAHERQNAPLCAREGRSNCSRIWNGAVRNHVCKSKR